MSARAQHAVPPRIRADADTRASWGAASSAPTNSNAESRRDACLAAGRAALRFFGGVGLGLGDGFAFVEAGPVVEGGEGAGLHAVNVEGAVEMIYFVLEDAGVPAGGLDEVGLGALVEEFDADGAGAGDDGGKTGEAEAAFVEIFYFVAPSRRLRD